MDGVGLSDLARLAVLAVFIALITLNTFRIDSNSHSVSDTLINVVPQTIIFVVLLIWVCV